MKKFIFGLCIIMIIIVIIIVSVNNKKNNEQDEHLSGYKDVQVPNDQVIVNLLEDVKGKSLDELVSIAHHNFETYKYKEAFNLYELAMNRMDTELTDEQFQEYYYLYAFIQSRKADCYYRLYEFEEAIILIDEAVEMCADFEQEYETFYILSRQAIIYSDYDLFMGYTNSENVINLLENIVDFETKETHEFYEYTKPLALQTLGEFYTFSPSVVNSRKAVQSYERLINNYIHDEDIYYRMSNAYIDNGQIEEAEELYEKLKNNGLKKVNQNAVEARLYFAYSDLNEAKKCIDKLGGITATSQEKAIKNNLLAIYYNEINDYESAHEALEQLLTEKPMEINNSQVIKLCKATEMNIDHYIEAIIEDRKNKPRLDLKVIITD